jgi:hypothetical protein
MFLRNSNVVSDFKIRLGYGITGQQEGIGNYDYISYYNLSNLTAPISVWRQILSNVPPLVDIMKIENGSKRLHQT